MNNYTNVNFILILFVHKRGLNEYISFKIEESDMFKQCSLLIIKSSLGEFPSKNWFTKPSNFNFIRPKQSLMI